MTDGFHQLVSADSLRAPVCGGAEPSAVEARLKDEFGDDMQLLWDEPARQWVVADWRYGAMRIVCTLGQHISEDDAVDMARRNYALTAQGARHHIAMSDQSKRDADLKRKAAIQEAIDLNHKELDRWLNRRPISVSVNGLSRKARRRRAALSRSR
jgi:hypothetical protein